MEFTNRERTSFYHFFGLKALSLSYQMRPLFTVLLTAGWLRGKEPAVADVGKQRKA
jgi:hypothetical protein